MSVATYHLNDDHLRLQLELEELEHRCVLSSSTCVADCGVFNHDGDVPPAYAPLSVTDGLISASLEDYRAAIDGADVLHDTMTASAMPEIATASFDDFSRAVVWSSADPLNRGIYFQRVDLAGNPVGSVSEIAAVDALTVSAVPVEAATLESGNLVVAWNDAAGLKLGIFTADGTAVVSPFLVGIGPAINASEFDVISTHDNNIAITWFNTTNTSIEVQYFDDVGNPFGPQLPLFTYSTGMAAKQLRLLNQRDSDFGILWTVADGTQPDEHFFSRVIGNVAEPAIALSTFAGANQLDLAVAEESREFATIHAVDQGGSFDLVIGFWDESGNLEDSIVAATLTDLVLHVPPRITSMDGGGYTITYATDDRAVVELVAVQLNAKGHAVADPVILNTADTTSQIAFVEPTTGSQMTFNVSWIASDLVSGDINIRSSSFRPGMLPVLLDPQEDPPIFDSIGGEPLLLIDGLSDYVLNLGNLETNGSWSIEAFETDVLIIFSDTELDEVTFSMRAVDPLDVDNVLVHRGFVLGATADNRLDATALGDWIDGGEGLDTAIYAGAFNEFRFTAFGDDLLVDSVAGGETDLLTSVERIRFDDITLPTSWVLANGYQANADSYFINEDSTIEFGDGDLMWND
ncbi:MAG: hypothetical protein AAF497_08280, partial [Planctomycetota bacterium]